MSLKKSCTDEEHRVRLEEIAKSDGKRARMAQRELDGMNAAVEPSGGRGK